MVYLGLTLTLAGLTGYLGYRIGLRYANGKEE